MNETGRCPISFSDINLPLIKGYELYLLNKDVGKGKTTKTTTVGNKVEKIICILKRAEQQGMIDIHESNLDKYKKPRSKEGDSNDICFGTLWQRRTGERFVCFAMLDRSAFYRYTVNK